MSITKNKINSQFDLLYLDYSEHLFTNVSCYTLIDGNLKFGKLHVTNQSLIFQAENLSVPLMKYFFNEDFSLRTLNKEDLLNLYNENKNNCDSPTKAYNINQKKSPMKKSPNIEKKRSTIFMFSPSNFLRAKQPSQKFEFKSQLSKVQTQNQDKSDIKSINISKMTTQNRKSTFAEKERDNNAPTTVQQRPSLEKQIENFFNPRNAMNNNISLSRTDTSSLDATSQNIRLNAKKQFNSISYGMLSSYFANLGYSFNSFLNIIVQANSISTTFSYILLSISYTKAKTLDRIKFENKDTSPLQKQSCLFIIKDNPSSLHTFLNDTFEFTEALTTHKEEDGDGIVSIISYRKIEELKNNYTIVDLNDKNDIGSFGALSGVVDKQKVFFCTNAMNITFQKYQNGLFLITNEKIVKFIPVNNNLNTRKISFHLDEVKYLIPYRFLYQRKAINIFLHNDDRKSSILINFDAVEDYTKIFNYMLNNSSRIDKNHLDINLHTNLWVDGLMTNYDYLMYLNELSSRSFNDISQYPIFPWVLSSYSTSSNKKIIDLNNVKNFRDLSKPIGLLNQRSRIILTDDINYIFRNYYIFPFVIFYYLMRSNPLLYLRYQGWSFGPPDRMFFSIENCFEMTVSDKISKNDSKELVPEFYDTELGGNFLVNIYNLNFGKMQNGNSVNNVKLPPWAKSPSDFVHIMRSALESEIVSNNLHHWIDMIFGVNQHGDDDIGNLFYYLRFEDCMKEVNLMKEDEKQGCIDDILECGQVPSLLFRESHPKKRSMLNMRDILLFSNAHHHSNKKDEIVNEKKNRMTIEVKYEKERREKEIQTEHIKKIFQERDAVYEKEINELEEKLTKIKTELLSNKTAISKMNSDLTQKFNEYQRGKEMVMNKVIQKISNEYKNKKEELIDKKKEMKKYLEKMEGLDNKYKKRKREFEEVIDKLTGKKEKFEKENKMLKDQVSQKSQYIRNLPYDIQASLES